MRRRRRHSVLVRVRDRHELFFDLFCVPSVVLCGELFFAGGLEELNGVGQFCVPVHDARADDGLAHVLRVGFRELLRVRADAVRYLE